MLTTFGLFSIEGATDGVILIHLCLYYEAVILTQQTWINFFTGKSPFFFLHETEKQMFNIVGAKTRISFHKEVERNSRKNITTNKFLLFLFDMS